MPLRAKISQLSSRARSLYRYCTSEVWHDTSGKWWVRVVMTVNVMVSKFLDKRLQDMACNLTYRTVLAAVPALAMLFAIGRGFGFQNLMQSELMRYFPAQRRALHEASQFVDSYLLHASQGLFVGIGIVFMLWTLISLMGNVESAFNRIWGVPRDRALARKLVDYTAFLIIIPVTLVCSAGIQIVLSSTLNNALSASSLISPLVHRLLDFTPIVLEWIAFVVAFKLVPDTQVSLKCAFVSGLISGTVFYLVEWLFVSGQLRLCAPAPGVASAVVAHRARRLCAHLCLAAQRRPSWQRRPRCDAAGVYRPHQASQRAHHCLDARQVSRQSKQTIK